MNRALIGLASNTSKKKQILQQVIVLISGQFPTARFSSCYLTEAVGTNRHPSYCNCVGTIETEQSYEECRLLFKAMERSFGRTAESKRLGFIPLDVDIIVWNDSLLKPSDWSQTYTQIGVRQISYRLSDTCEPGK